ncbi:hypothetical protein FKM82_026942 [Ascaphus truei]
MYVGLGHFCLFDLSCYFTWLESGLKFFRKCSYNPSVEKEQWLKKQMSLLTTAERDATSVMFESITFNSSPKSPSVHAVQC